MFGRWGAGFPISLPAGLPDENLHDALASDWRDVFRLETAFKSREKVGMPGPIQIEQQIKRWRDTLKA